MPLFMCDKQCKVLKIVRENQPVGSHELQRIYGVKNIHEGLDLSHQVWALEESGQIQSDLVSYTDLELNAEKDSLRPAMLIRYWTL